MRKVIGIAGAALAALSTVGLSGAVASAATTAATPGGDAQYQVEISYNLHVPSVMGGGVWLWLELDKNGTGIYDGSDCVHMSGFNEAISDQGNLTWVDENGQLTISGIKLFGAPVAETIVVPETYGHYNLAVQSVIQKSPVLLLGDTMVQVAP